MADIDTLVSNTAVTQEETLEALGTVREHIDTIVAALAEDLGMSLEEANQYYIEELV